MKRKLISIGAIVLALALLFTLMPSCGKEKGEVKTLTIGLLYPLSGPAAPWGVNFELGAKWAIEHINAAGGLKVGKDTYMIETVSCDTKLTGSVAATCATMFVDQGIHYVCGPIFLSPAVDPIFTPAKVFYAQGGTWPSSKDRPYQIVASSHPYYWVNGWWKMVAKHNPDIETVIVINPPGTDGDNWHDAAVTTMEELGLDLLDTARYEVGTVDFYPLLTPLVAQNPDVLCFGFAPPGDAAVLTKQARELGYTGWLSVSAGTGTSQLRDVVGDENMWGILMNDPDLCSPVYPPKSCELLQEWQERYAEAPGQSMMRTPTMGYDAMMMYATAIEQAGSIDPDEVMKVLDDPNFRFPTVFSDSTALGGWESYGIRRSFPLNDDYGEIIDPDNINLSMELTITNVP